MSGAQVEHAVRPLAEVDERQRQLPLDLAHAADHLGAQRLAGDVVVAAISSRSGRPSRVTTPRVSPTPTSR